MKTNRQLLMITASAFNTIIFTISVSYHYRIRFKQVLKINSYKQMPEFTLNSRKTKQSNQPVKMNSLHGDIINAFSAFLNTLF